jgi:hypothetical protein
MEMVLAGALHQPDTAKYTACGGRRIKERKVRVLFSFSDPCEESETGLRNTANTVTPPHPLLFV